MTPPEQPKTFLKCFLNCSLLLPNFFFMFMITFNLDPCGFIPRFLTKHDTSLNVDCCISSRSCSSDIPQQSLSISPVSFLIFMCSVFRITGLIRVCWQMKGAHDKRSGLNSSTVDLRLAEMPLLVMQFLTSSQNSSQLI